MDFPSFAFGALFMATFIGLVWFLAGKLTAKPKSAVYKQTGPEDVARWTP